MNTSKARTIEIIIPVFNEAKVIQNHLQHILDLANMGNNEVGLKLLIVDDGSTDNTRQELINFCSRQSNAKFIGFTRNFGKEAAIAAGLYQTKADAVILMDSDLQHPPELIPQMIALWNDGFQVVEAIKSARGTEGILSKICAKVFYDLFLTLSGLDIRNHSDFKLLDRHVVDQFNALHERNRFFRGLIQWMNYPTARLFFEVPHRAGGASHWSQFKLIKYALHNIISFSAIPLQLVTWGGIISLLIGLVFAIIALTQKIEGRAIDGFTTVILLVIFFNGILMMSLGIIGQYLSKIYEEVKHRPTFILNSAQPIPNRTVPDESAHKKVNI